VSGEQTYPNAETKPDHAPTSDKVNLSFGITLEQYRRIMRHATHNLTDTPHERPHTQIPLQ
jgi:hypothetical protein